MVRVPAPIPVVAAALALAAFFMAAALRGPVDLNLDAPLVSNAAAGPSPATSERRLLLVLLDGVRLDAARAMPTLRTLAADPTGSFVELEPTTPTFSAVQYVALMTGLPARESGIRTNRKIRPSGLESIASRVRAAGGRTAVFSDGVTWWPRLFPGHFDRHEVAWEDEALEASIALAGSARFALIHWTAVDSLSHDEGATSPQTAAALARIDAELLRLVTAWGWPGLPVMVMTDHGHLPEGGHGGDEPDARTAWVVTSGAGFRHATPPRSPLTAVAATATTVLGVPSPTAWIGGLPVVDGAGPPLTAAPAPVEERTSALGALGLLPLGALGVFSWRRTAAGRRAALGVGLAPLVLGGLTFWLWHGPLSLSLTRGHSDWGWHLGLLFCGVALLSFALRPLSASPALALTVACSPAALILARFGAFAPRPWPETGLLAALPIATFAATGGLCLGAAVGTLVAAWRASRRRSSAAQPTETTGG